MHRPGRELQRLTPANCGELLFDDVLWARRARQEHDAFADLLRDRGVEVLLLHELLAETLDDGKARAWVLERSINDRMLGPELAREVGAFVDRLTAPRLAATLIGGCTRRRASPRVARARGFDARARRSRHHSPAEPFVRAATRRAGSTAACR